MNTARTPYPSDVSDGEWEFLLPYLTLMDEDAPQRKYPLRAVFNALRYIVKTDCHWRYLPHDNQHWKLRRQVRRQHGREEEPSACMIDAQSVKTPTSVPASRQGKDAGKQIAGRKRSIVIDTIGLVLAVLVTAARVQDSVAGTQLLDQVSSRHPGIRNVCVARGYS